MIKKQLVTMLVSLIVSMLTPELLQQFANAVLSFAENFVLGTKSQLDDAAVLPLTRHLRMAFDIPDTAGDMLLPPTPTLAGAAQQQVEQAKPCRSLRS